MGATLEELAKGIHGAVPRVEAKRLAKLHGHRWWNLRHALEEIGPGAFLGELSTEAADLRDEDALREPLVELVDPQMFEAALRVADEGIAKGWIRG